MSHVDDGLLHAYLDGALGMEGPERQEVEAHLARCADCRTRLEAAGADREAAGEILGLLSPEAIEPPPFEALATGGGRGGDRDLGRSGAGSHTGSDSGGSRRTSTPVWVPLGWAATVLLALGGGWMAREATLSVSVGDAPTAPAAMEAAADAADPAADVAMGRGARQADGPPAAEATRDADPPLVAASPPATPDTATVDPTVPETTVAGAQDTAAPPVALAPQIAAEPEALVAGGARDAADALVPSDEAAAAVAALTARADALEAWVAVTPAQAAAELGRPPLDLDGLPWDRMELARVDTNLLVRTVHPMDEDARVEFVQAVAAPAGRVLDEIGVTGLARLPVRSELQQRAAAPPVAAFDAAPAAEPVVLPVAGAEAGAVRILLRGLYDAETLALLLERVR